MQLIYPGEQGLYHPEFEHDSCGVGLLVNINGEKSHEIVEKGLQVLEHMVHRGAEGADNKTGDGAGILIQIPHEFILLQGIPVPEKGRYGTGLVFLPKNDLEQAWCIEAIKNVLIEQKLTLLAIRDVPVNNNILGETALETEPCIKQIFITGETSREDFERNLYICRKKIEKSVLSSNLRIKRSFYIVSLSTQNIVYKGLLSSLQLRQYFPDLTNPYFTSGLSLIHSRFSTNTFPTWDLAQPYRLLGHNGEINTIRGNRTWMEARESLLNPKALGCNIKDISPIVQPEMSDSASLDNVLEFFVMSGMSLPHALSMMVPESWNDKNPISSDLKAFYEYHSILMEPWDGPATLLFSDGRYAGGMLDRNGLRPARFLITNNNMLAMASEVGVLPFKPSEIKEKGRLHPGKMLMIDTQIGVLYRDEELKEILSQGAPYKEWLSKNRINLEKLSSGRTVKNTPKGYSSLLKIFGYTKEDTERIIIPMCVDGKEPVSSMGNDTPLAVLSNQPQRLFNYFRQQFAQVTNPPIDSIREELIMSLTGYIGAIDKNLLEPSAEHCKMLKMKSPILTNQDLDILCNLSYKGFRTTTLPMVFKVEEGASGLEKALEELCKKAETAVDKDYNYIILSDRGIDEFLAPIPSLLAVSAVHHYLISRRKRMQIALILETAEPRENMHFALLLGYGASAINPYLAFGVLDDLVKTKKIYLDFYTAEKNYIKAIDKGLLKIMSKMGISTLRSYRGAKIFEAIGVASSITNSYFGGTTSKIEGIDLQDIARETLSSHMKAFDSDLNTEPLENIGQYAYRKNGERHAWNPETISALQLATRMGSYQKFKEFTNLVDDKTEPMFLRDFMQYKRNPIDINLVEPVEAITRRFVTGAMSFGSISKEAHEALAMAMNKLGGKSNTGEGGEDPERYKIREDGSSARSAIKQVASGRFGVTAEYLVNADELQIKVAQGAKPGEGGQLPGFKVNQIIAKTRHSIPGISLISPPPHHDIYSIEDLAQLIFDLKNVNPKARISVKLVSESGVGTIAAGVAKAKADMIVISGAEGGTGASPSSSIKHAGLPPELGLAETQQTLVMNNLRGQVVLQSDGQLKTGKDIVTMAILGAEEFGFATSSLIVLGCVMMRKCHLNTCPVGVATQDEKLRKRFAGKHEYLINFFTFLAQNVREHLAEMGYTRLDDIIGHTELLTYKPAANHLKAHKIDLSKILFRPENTEDNALKMTSGQKHQIETVLDEELIRESMKSIESCTPVQAGYKISNTNRSTGAMLSGVIAAKYGNAGLPDNTIRCTFKGSAGQSFGAFLAKGITFRLEGDSNDYLGKGLSGGRIIVVPPAGITYAPNENIIAGNTILYGATAGEIYINGRVGERFCVRNSGATAIVEGVGDHCCEYMTGGCTVVLGSVGRNFAAGMSGGIAYVWNPEGDFDYFCNMEMVELSLVEEASDMKDLKMLITKHFQYTQSPLAKRILKYFPEQVEKFIKVMPIEYKKVLHDEKAEALKQKIAQVERDY
ncbi:MAG: glutamate synthase large subunit [Bacteroidales bacterium]|nr:glutamate synthase large subunit [Bacteroidales bacterium]